MGRVWSLTKKELRSYFNSPIAYIVIGVLLVGIGYFFFGTFFLGGQTTLRPFFQFAGWSFLLFAPAITMRSFAEERKTGTIETLLTLPIREWEAVAGKFLAAWLVLAVYLAVTIAYPISISFLGDLDWGPVIGGYAGLMFLGGVYIAIGVFASAVSRNQVVSLIIAFVICLALFWLDLVLPLIPIAFHKPLSYIAVDTHFQNIARGVLDSRDIFYYVSLAGIFLFLAAQIVEGRMGDKTAARRLNRPVYVLSALGVAFFLNLVSLQWFTRVDITEDKMHTLSDSTEAILADLDDQLLIQCYVSEKLPAQANLYRQTLQDMLEEYRAASNGKLRFVFTDPAKPTESGEPDEAAIRAAEAAGVPRVTLDAIEKDRRVEVRVFFGLAMYYHDRTEAIPVVLQSMNNLEYEITSRITKLIRDKTPVVAFLGGFGADTPDTTMRAAGELLGKNYEVKTIDPTKEGQTLEGVDMLVVAGPREPLPEWVRFEIDQYLMDGGRIAFLCNRNDINMMTMFGRPIDDGLTPQLEAYGVRVNSDLVLDARNQTITVSSNQGGMMMHRMIAFPPFVVVPEKDLAHVPVTKNLGGVELPFVSSLTVEEIEGVTPTVVATSSDKAWLFTNSDTFLVEPQYLPKPLPEDLAGPYPLVVTLEGSFDSAFTGTAIPVKEDGSPVGGEMFDHSPTTRIAVVGGSSFARDDFRKRLGVLLFVNLVDWLSQDDRLIALRSKTVVNRPLNQDQIDAVGARYKYGNMIGLPLVFVLFGLVRWRLRSSRKGRGYQPASGNRA